MAELTERAISNCSTTPQCSECLKYTLSYCERYYWSCDKTCKLYHQDERFPEGYAEIDYGDRDDCEAIDGSHFDEMNFLRYFER